MDVFTLIINEDLKSCKIKNEIKKKIYPCSSVLTGSSVLRNGDPPSQTDGLWRPSPSYCPYRIVPLHVIPLMLSPLSLQNRSSIFNNRLNQVHTEMIRDKPVVINLKDDHIRFFSYFYAADAFIQTNCK